jgi:phosphomevalonate kinase
VTVARAPGKIVISGAYAVLSGAPAIVSAVSRYVVADTSRPADFTTNEVRVGLNVGEQAPWFEASALRQDGRKLGLGSSAAILVASLYALEQDAEPDLDETALRARVFERALSAHRKAQGGGSGVDVAASTFGGTLVYRRQADGAERLPVTLPPELSVEVWVCPSSASTPELLAAVAKLGQSAPAVHAEWLGAQAAAAARAASSIARQDAADFVAALRAQHHALLGLGTAAGVPIVTPELAELGPRAETEGGVLLPAGAGGGDIALFIGRAPSTDGLRAELENFAHRRLSAALSAPGVSVA